VVERRQPRRDLAAPGLQLLDTRAGRPPGRPARHHRVPLGLELPLLLPERGQLAHQRLGVLTAQLADDPRQVRLSAREVEHRAVERGDVALVRVDALQPLELGRDHLRTGQKHLDLAPDRPVEH
jgi:hypothetical protein